MVRCAVVGLCALGFWFVTVRAFASENEPDLVPSRDVPVMSGIAECELADKTNPVVRLSRTGQAFLMAAPWRFPFFPRDILENLSRDVIRLENVRCDAAYAMEPSSRLEFQPRGVIPLRGTVRMEFKRGDGVFRILLPAVVRVRGEARFDVVARPDAVSEILLWTGSIGIVAGNGVEMSMGAGQKALISARGSDTIRLLPLGGSDAPVEEHPEDKAKRLIP